jgi:hypothetical protein
LNFSSDFAQSTRGHAKFFYPGKNQISFQGGNVAIQMNEKNWELSYLMSNGRF